MFNDESYCKLLEATFSAEDRRQLAKEGKAKPDGSFPIRNCTDFGHAVNDWGRGGSTSSDKAWIMKRGHALGCKIPDTWKEAIDLGGFHGLNEEQFTRFLEKDLDDDGDDDESPEGDTDYTKDGKKRKAPLKEVAGQEGEQLTISEGCQLIEADKTGSQVQFLLIEKGTSKNGYHYSDKTLRSATPLFEGVYAFADHTNDQEQRIRPERSVHDKVGRWTGVNYGSANVGGRVTEGVIATLKVIDPIWKQRLRESVEQGESDFYGVSIDAMGPTVEKVQAGRRVKEVQKIHKVFSVDIVTMPSAGGRLMRLVASDQGRRITLPDEEISAGVATLTPEALTEAVRSAVADILKDSVLPLSQALKQQNTELEGLREVQRVESNKTRYETAIKAATGLSDMGQERLRQSFGEAAKRRDLSDDEIVSSIRESLQYEARLLEHATGSGGGPRSTPRAYVGATEFNKHYQALVGLFENKDQVIDGNTIPRYRSIKEAYCRWTARDSFEVDPMEIQRAFAVTYDSAYDHQRIQESVSTASWGQVYADVLYLMLIKSYRVNPVYNKWRAVVSDIENVPDFQQRHWTRLGGYSDLGAVPESATYQPLTSSTNEEVKYSVSKRGGLDDVTFEAIANDRVGAIRRIPIAMARSAARTLYKFVFQTITTTNPVMSYDSVALYNSAHGNGPDSNALSLTAVQTAIVKMRSQTAFAEGSEILGERNKPRIFMVPTQLEFVAQRILNPSDSYLAAIANPSTEQSLDPQAYKGLGMDYVVLDFLTSASGWYAVADPAEVATFVIGFLNGKEDPELFVQDQPNVGSNFTADKVTYKVRHIYGGVVEDHRSFYQGMT